MRFIYSMYAYIVVYIFKIYTDHNVSTAYFISYIQRLRHGLPTCRSGVRPAYIAQLRQVLRRGADGQCVFVYTIVYHRHITVHYYSYTFNTLSIYTYIHTYMYTCTQIMSMEGYGTDSFIYLPRLGGSRSVVLQ